MAPGKLAKPTLGFIALDVHFHRPPGDAFSQRTWPFPILRRTAENSSLANVVTNESYPDEVLEKFVEAGKWLAEEGCVGIITSCGFLAMAQQQLASRLPIPIATSALIQIPSIRSFIPPGRTVGVITFDGSSLGQKHFESLGILDSKHIPVIGAPNPGALHGLIRKNDPYDYGAIEAEMLTCAKTLVEQNPDVGAILLECTQMPPYAEAIQHATGLPVFDVYTLGTWFYSGLTRGPFLN